MKQVKIVIHIFLAHPDLDEDPPDLETKICVVCLDLLFSHPISVQGVV
jgi:hypothetical protein